MSFFIVLVERTCACMLHYHSNWVLKWNFLVPMEYGPFQNSPKMRSADVKKRQLVSSSLQKVEGCGVNPFTVERQLPI